MTIYHRSRYRFIFIFTFIFTFLFHFLAGTSSLQASTSPVGANLSLTQAGLDVLTFELTDKLLKDGQTISVPPIETSADYGIKVKLEGISASIKVADLKIMNREGYLDLAMALKEAKVHINNLQAKKGTFLGDISVNCRDIDLHLGHPAAAPLRAEMVPGIANGNVQLSPRQVNFVLRDEHFKVQGPRHCSGGPLERFIKDIIHQALKKSREKIQELVKNTIPKASEYLGQELTKFTRKDLHFQFDFPPYLPQLKVEGRTLPQALAVQGGDLTVAFDWIFNEYFLREIGSQWGSNDGNEVKDNLKSNGLNGSDEVGKLFAKLEVERALFNRIFSFIYLRTRPELERGIERLILPQLSTLLNQEMMSQYLPDLGHLTLDTPELKGSLRLAGHPELLFRPVTQAVMMSNGQAILSLLVKREGQWRPYFHFYFDLDLLLKLILQKERLDIEFHSLDSYQVKGEWDEAYTPQDGTFNEEDFVDLVETLREIINFSRPKVSLDLLSIKIGANSYYFQDFKVKDDSLVLDLLFQ